MEAPPGGFPDDLEAAILELKHERKALLLAHYYQDDEIQDLADVVGDSLALAQAAQQSGPAQYRPLIKRYFQEIARRGSTKAEKGSTKQ